MVTKRRRKQHHNGRAQLITCADGTKKTVLVTTTPLARNVAYRVLIDGKPSSWGGVIKREELVHRGGVQPTLRMMDKCGFYQPLFDRSRHRFCEKFDKNQKWKESIKAERTSN